MTRIRDAQQLISLLEDGDTVRDLSEEIVETIQALHEQVGNRPKAKASGKVTLTINIVMENGMANITPEITSKRPKKPRGTSMYWPLEDGTLSSQHPKQMSMFEGPREIARAPA